MTPSTEYRPCPAWRSRRLCGPLALVTALLVLLLPAPAGSQQATTVAVGDSITNLAEQEIMGQFDSAGWPGDVLSQGGVQIYQMRPWLRLVAGIPNLRRVFLFAGTNDALAYALGHYDIELSRRHLNGAVHDVIDKQPKACVFLVTLKEQGNAFVDPADYVYATRRLNDHMREIDAKYSKVHLIDWNDLTKPHDGGKGEDDWMPDNIHPNQAGQNALADYYRFFGSLVSGCGTTLP